jgi:uncharacterized Zn-binding protein involved in type VI secretion
MTIAVHRQNDARVCGATTVVVGQDSVFANDKLIAVNGDPNTHGAGNLVAGSNHVFVNGIAVVNNTPDSAASDNALHPPTSTKTAAGSPNVFVGDG